MQPFLYTWLANTDMNYTTTEQKKVKEILDTIADYCHVAYLAKEAIEKYKDANIESLITRRNAELKGHRVGIHKLLEELKQYY